ncbi:MAG: D-alanine--D-alanine ligase [Thermodesulfobacteriota bacterium]
MDIGLTYDLRSQYLAQGYDEETTAEFDRDDTIESIAHALKELGHRTHNIGNLHELLKQLVDGKRWDLVFNIAEGLHGIGREAQVPAVLDAYQIPYTFSDPMVMSLTLHKGMTKRIVRDAGFPTPDFQLMESVEDIASVSFSPPYFIKPVAEGTGKGITAASIIQDLKELRSRCVHLLQTYHQSVLVERFLPGREYTVGIVGTGRDAEVLGTIEVVLLENAEPGVYSYVNKERCEELVEYRLVNAEKDASVREAQDIALEVWRLCECRDGGRIDLRCDEAGDPQFLEVNPLAGLHPAHSDLPIICNLKGIPYIHLIERIVASARVRVVE